MLETIVGKPYTPKRNLKHGVPVMEVCESKYEGCVNQGEHSHETQTNPPVNGTGWLERKASGDIVYHTPWMKAHKSFTMKPLKARTEASAKSFDRMKKECAEQTKDNKHAAMTGRPCADGYKLVNTNGHWALLERGEGVGQPMAFIGDLKGYRATFLDNPEFYLAIQRAAIAAALNQVQIRASAERQEITITSKSEGCEFDETLRATVTTNWTLAINCEYLTTALGSWPLTLWVKDTDSAVVLEPASREWRFVIMLMKIK